MSVCETPNTSNEIYKSYTVKIQFSDETFNALVILPAAFDVTYVYGE